MISQNALAKRFIPVFIQRAEAHRKPRWLPVAKSKIYRIPKRPVLSEEERVEIKRINDNYHTQMRAIRWFYHAEMIRERSTKESASSEMSIKLEAEEWAKCVELNDAWNKQAALDREERLKKERAQNEEYALNKMQRHDEILRSNIEKASEEIRIQKELSKTFVTPETLEEAIEQALANPKDYNFALDLKGNRYLGRDSLIVPPKEEAAA